MRINHNMTALNTYNQLTRNEAAQSKTMGQLSTGKRINSAADDAAGYAISNRMENQIRGLAQATTNSQNGISLVQTATGALSQTSNILQRMRELAVNSASDTSTADDRQQMQKEMDQLTKQISTISNTTTFNGKNLLAGGFTNQQVQTGANAGESLSLDIGAFDAKTLGLTAAKGATVTDGGSIQGAILTSGATAKTGTYTVEGTVTTSGTTGGPATGTGTVNLDQTSKSPTQRTLKLTVDGSTSGSITIDAQKYSSMNDLVKDVQSKIDANSALAGKVTVGVNGSGTELTFTPTSVGAASKVKVSGAAGDTLGFSGAASGASGSNATVSLNLKDSNGNIVNTQSVSLATAGSGGITSPSVKFSDGISVTLATGGGTGNSGALAKLNSAITSSTIDVVAANSTAATTGPNGAVIQDATVEKGILIDTQGNANDAIKTIDNAINTVNSASSTLGAIQNRFEDTVNTLGTTSQNLTSAESQITDVDMAQAVMENSKNSILSQAAQAMLGQAKSQPQSVLQLLQG
jgi:flagellin